MEGGADEDGCDSAGKLADDNDDAGDLQLPTARKCVVMFAICLGEKKDAITLTWPNGVHNSNANIASYTSATVVDGITSSIPPAFYPTEAEKRGNTASQVRTYHLY